MDVERTMQFILETQARTEAVMAQAAARAEKAEARMDRLEAHAEKADARMDKFEVRMNALVKLMGQGMRILARLETKIEALTVAQRKTERTLQTLVRSLNNGRNGRHS